MKLEIIILFIIGFIVFNIYYDWKFIKMFYLYKKYFTIAVVIILGLLIYLLIKRDPLQTKKILLYANNVVKYMPIDKKSIDVISPILDFTNKQNSSSSFMTDMNTSLNQTTIKATKRSVSETKKKYVASQQNWRCGQCNSQLNHTYEIDHRVRLEYGGSNDVNNLVALCRNCHGEKTAKENM
jgi:5-methylcytosine-specific restriction endonuclease McrA